MMEPTFTRLVEEQTGRTIKEIRSTPLDRGWEVLEGRLGHRVRLSVNWPFVGRGSVMHTRTASRDQVERQVDEALGR